jgi:hypothetical protein
MSQGKLNGMNFGNGQSSYNTGMSPQQPNLSTQIAQQGMSPTPNQPTIGQFGNAFGAPGPVGSVGGFGSSQSNMTNSAQPVAPQSIIDRSLVNGAGPDPQPIGPASPVTEDSLTGLPGPDGIQTGQFHPAPGSDMDQMYYGGLPGYTPPANHSWFG